MTNEQIRKLLGGYATNTLTEAERKSLFDAALDDQELFDALHQEQALKDLLADPISREQVRQALEKPGDTRAPWWSRWWTWTGAAAAVAATVMIVAITRPAPKPSPEVAAQLSKSEAGAQPLEKMDSGVKAKDVKVAEPAPTPPAKPARARVAGMRAGAAVAKNERKDLDSVSERLPPPPASTQQVEVTASAPAASAPAAPAQLQSRSSDTQSLAQQSQSTLSASLRDKEQDQLGAGAVGGVPMAVLKSGLAPVSYKVLRRDSNGVDKPLAPGVELKAGDLIRFTVVPAMSGYLFLYRREPSGEWTRIFPQPATGLRVSANASSTIPDSPITVTDTDQNLRIALTSIQNVTGALSNEMRRSEKKAKTSSLADAAASAPLFVDLTIGPKRIP